MGNRDRVLLGAIVVSLALHLAALFGTPRFDLGWLYQDVRPAPIEAQIVVREPPARVVAATAARPLARKPAPRPQARPAPKPPSIESASALEPPSPDGEPMAPTEQVSDGVAAPSAADTAAASAAAQAWHPGTLDEAVALAKARSKLVLVDFYSDG